MNIVNLTDEQMMNEPEATLKIEGIMPDGIKYTLEFTVNDIYLLKILNIIKTF